MSSKAVYEESAKLLIYNSICYSKLAKNPLRVVKVGDDVSLVTDEWILLNIGSTSGILDRFLIEPFVPHEQQEEYYLCMYTQRNSNVILFHHAGGVDVGEVDSKAKRFEVSVEDIMKSGSGMKAGCSADQLLQSSLLSGVKCPKRARMLADFIVELHSVFDKLYFTYLEINPLVICKWNMNTNKPNDCNGSSYHIINDNELQDGDNDINEQLYIHILDVAAKLDQCAEHLFTSSLEWSEAYIAKLDARTGASLKLTILNPNGRIWTMSAGGGASVIYADTVCELAEKVKAAGGTSQGVKDLANYGEYSGAPSEELTYEYSKTILTLMTTGELHPDGKVLLIGGGIANFTNIAATFKGIVRALTEFKEQLKRHNIRIFVRRAGPNYQEGLRVMRELGRTIDIPIYVFGPETHMTAIVSMAFGLRQIPPPTVDHIQSSADTLSLYSYSGSGCEHKNSEKSTPVVTKQTRKVSELSSTINTATTTTTTNGNNHETIYEEPLFTMKTKCLIWGLQYMLNAMHKHPDARVLVNFASLRVAYDICMEAMEVDCIVSSNYKENGISNEHNDTSIHNNINNNCLSVNEAQIKCIAIIAEGIPENMTRRLIQRSKERNILLIGPATVGGLKSGCFKIGNTGGMTDNILASKLYRPGSVAYVSRSGGMSNELNNIISMNSDGVYEGVAIGGDRFPGSTFIDHILRYENNPEVGMIVVLGEVGGIEEYAIIEAVKLGKIKKPIVAWCIGSCGELLSAAANSNDNTDSSNIASGSIQFGHAGACANSLQETATAKNYALASVGIHVPESFDELDLLIRRVFDELVRSGQLIPKTDHPPRTVPMDYEWAKFYNFLWEIYTDLFQVEYSSVNIELLSYSFHYYYYYYSLKELGLIRRPVSFTSTICDDRGEELLYAGMPISHVIEQDLGIGGVLGLLWFKRRLPEYATKFLELCLIITADHGPAVSGAHNTIVATRAGKDLISSLVSGLLTICIISLFGGALDAAARQFSQAYDAGLTPIQFVNQERQASRLIMGIGHRIKSITNPDKRVQLLSNYVHEHFVATPVVDYALEVEKVTTNKFVNQERQASRLIMGIGHRIKSITNPDKRVQLLSNYVHEHFVATPVVDYALEVEKVTTNKRPNLILNVDGMIGVAMVDLLRSSGHFTREEAEEYITIGTLNGLFVLGRSIGFIGHYLDQKRLHQGLYRHPWEDISYMLPKHP
ncbi:ATP citrate (pro-S)-lyase [Schistosoma bovis]|uniref:ATP citrate synthase n=1 Tax=Schistosoma bovis TaxID=6184 RepID=A0A430QR98_SCHBO|nr:ATP citrate (pro-S)-lyase [Schistosoma bovis]